MYGSKDRERKLLKQKPDNRSFDEQIMAMKKIYKRNLLQHVNLSCFIAKISTIPLQPLPVEINNIRPGF